MKPQETFVLNHTLLAIMRRIVIYHNVDIKNINSVLSYVNAQLKNMNTPQLPEKQKYRLKKLINENNLEQEYCNCQQSDARLNNIQAQESKKARIKSIEKVNAFYNAYKTRTL